MPLHCTFVERCSELMDKKHEASNLGRYRQLGLPPTTENAKAKVATKDFPLLINYFPVANLVYSG